MLKLTLLVCTTLLCAASTFAQLNLNLLSNYAYPPSRGECSDIWGYVDEFGNEYAVVGNQNGTSIVDVTDPANPTEVFYTGGATTIWRDMKVWQDAVYITNEGAGGLKIIDLTNLPGALNAGDVYSYSGSSYPFNTAHNIFMDEQGRAYIIGADYGVGGAIILDVDTNPLAPIELGVYDDYYLHDIYVRGDTLWGGAIYDGFFTVVDVSNPAATVTMATQLTPSTFSHNVWLSDDGNTLFTTDEVSNGYIGAYDVSDISNISELDRIQSSPGQNVIPHNTFVVNDYLVTSYYRDGVTIHDVSNPANMIEVGNYDTSPAMSGDGFNGVWGVYPYLPSGNIIASDIEKGLFVFGPTYSPGAYLEGVVTDLVTTNPINNALVEILTTPNDANSDAAGTYSTGTASGGTYSVQFSKLGYVSETVTGVVLVNGQTTILDVQLDPLQTFTLQGEVIDQNGDPVINAQVYIVNGVYETTVTTNGLGQFSVANFLEDTYDIYIGKWGYHSFCALNQDLLIANNPQSYQINQGYSDDFSLDLGWSASGTANTGDWERDIPNGTVFTGSNANPGADATGDCGEKAYVTGNSGTTAGDDDIDDGIVELTSPIFDLSLYNDPYVEFSRWFFNDGSGTPNDSLVIELSNGTTTIEIDAAVANDPDASTWADKSVRVLDFLTPSSTMQLKVRAMDLSPGHISEAGFDKFRVTDADPVGIDELADEVELSIYPSPFNESLTILANVLADQLRVEVIELSTGRMVDERVFENSSKVSFKTPYAQGVYIVRVFGDDTLLKTERVVKL